MPDLTITSTQVLPGSGAQYYQAIAAAQIAAGDAVYLPTDNTANLADCETSATTAAVKGVAVNDAESGQPVVIQTGGLITLGAAAAPSQGTIYVLSASGGIAPAADLGGTDYISIIGVGAGSNQLKLGINNTGLTVS